MRVIDIEFGEARRVAGAGTVHARLALAEADQVGLEPLALTSSPGRRCRRATAPGRPRPISRCARHGGRGRSRNATRRTAGSGVVCVDSMDDLPRPNFVVRGKVSVSFTRSERSRSRTHCKK
jgi:hypothetical protein